MATIAMVVLAGPSGAEAAPARPAPQPVSVAPTGAPETIAYTHRKPPTLSAGYLQSSLVTSQGLAGLVISLATGAAMDHISGSNTMKQYQLSDPSPDLAHALAEALAIRRGAITLDQPIEVKGERPKALAKAAGGARYVVDVRTLGWQVAGMSTKRSQYPSKYSANLNVIDGQTGTVAVQSTCYWASPLIRTSTGEGPEGEKGEMLRSHFASAGEVCLEQFKITMKSLFAPAPRLTAEAEPERRDPRIEAPLSDPVEEWTAPAIEMAVTPPVPVTVTALPQRPAIDPRDPARTGREAATLITRAELPRSSPARRLSVAPSLGVTTQTAPRNLAQAALSLAYSEYPYARSGEAPPSRTPPPEYRYAGRDANGYLVWPGKRP